MAAIVDTQRVYRGTHTEPVAEGVAARSPGAFLRSGLIGACLWVMLSFVLAFVLVQFGEPTGEPQGASWVDARGVPLQIEAVPASPFDRAIATN